MTVDELIQALQQLDQPDLEVWVPCPHCCGQPGADFCRLDADHCQVMERRERQVLLLGDPGRVCLDDSRSDSRRRVSRAARKHVAATLAAEFGLQHGRILDRRDLEQLHQEITGRNLSHSRYSRLSRPNLIFVEASGSGGARYIAVVTPYRATLDDIEEVEGHSAMLTRMTGRPCYPMIASVWKDRQAEGAIAAGRARWHPVPMEDLDPD